MASKSPKPIGIVVPGPKASSKLASRLTVNRIPLPGLQPFAPAWFYSALNWLGKTYYDANNVAQGFNVYMAGSDSVDRLIEVLEDKVVRPAEAKFNELLARRTKQLRVENV
jgi:hypothetical protein